MCSQPQQDHNAGIQNALGNLKAQLHKGLAKDEVVLKMKTECLKTATHIDHLCLEITAKDESSFDDVNHQVHEILRACGIKISATKPRNLQRFDDGYVLVSQPTGQTDKRIGAIKTLRCDFKFCLELNGYLCALVYLNFGSFKPIYGLAIQHSSNIRRIDIAYDHIGEKYDLRQVGKDYSSGKYNSKTGCKPKTEKYTSETGASRYIGSHHSEKSIRVYDKSSEVGLMPSHPYYGIWTRHEVILRNRGKISIPLETLLNPDGAFVAAYPKAHNKMVKGAVRINIGRITSSHLHVKMEKSLDYTKRQCGRTLAESQKVYGDQLLERVVRRDKAPSGFNIPEPFEKHLKWHCEQSQLKADGGDDNA